jgi:hypothetical protein
MLQTFLVTIKIRRLQAKGRFDEVAVRDDVFFAIPSRAILVSTSSKLYAAASKE